MNISFAFTPKQAEVFKSVIGTALSSLKTQRDLLNTELLSEELIVEQRKNIIEFLHSTVLPQLILVEEIDRSISEVEKPLIVGVEKKILTEF